VEGLKYPVFGSETARIHPLDIIPEDVIIETEDGLEVSASSAEEEDDEEESGGVIDLYLKYSELDIISLEKEKSDIRIELTRNKEKLKLTNQKLETEVPGIKYAETFNIIIPEINDPSILENLLDDPAIEPDYKQLIEDKVTLLNYYIDMKKELKVLDSILKKKKKLRDEQLAKKTP
jgi:hypothetical protein